MLTQAPCSHAARRRAKAKARPRQMSDEERVRDMPLDEVREHQACRQRPEGEQKRIELLEHIAGRTSATYS